MAGITFDTHKAITDLVKAGFKQEQAEAIINFEKEKDTSQLVTKSDLSEFKVEMYKFYITAMGIQTGLIVALLKLV